MFRNDVVGVGLSSAGHLGHAGLESPALSASRYSCCWRRKYLNLWRNDRTAWISPLLGLDALELVLSDEYTV